MATKLALLTEKDGSKSEDGKLMTKTAIQPTGVKCFGDIGDRATVNIGEEKTSQFEAKIGGDVMMMSRVPGSGKVFQVSSHDPLRLVMFLVLVLVVGVVVYDHCKLERLEQRVLVCERLNPASFGGFAAVAVGGDADELMRALEAADVAAEVHSGPSVVPAGDEKFAENVQNTNAKAELPNKEESSYDVTSDEDVDDVIDDVMRGEDARHLGTNIRRRRRSADGERNGRTTRRPHHGQGGRTKVVDSDIDSSNAKKQSDPMSAAYHLQLHINEDGQTFATGQGTPYKIWAPANWTNEEYYHYDNNHGKLRVKQPGIYFVYAQILYQNLATRSSYAVMVDERQFIQCFTSVDAVSNTTADARRYKTCHVAAATKLDRNEKIWIKELYGQTIDTDAESSYFGIVKLADLSS